MIPGSSTVGTRRGFKRKSWINENKKVDGEPVKCRSDPRSRGGSRLRGRLGRTDEE